MSDSNGAHEIARRTIALRPEGYDAVVVRENLFYRGSTGEELPFDLYLPPAPRAGDALAHVVLVPGYPDPGLRRFLGCGFRELGSTTSWARAIAAQGLAAIAPDNRDPRPDLEALLAALRARAGELGLDPERRGLWAASGNAPLALSLLDLGRGQGATRARCAALLYPFLLDLDGATEVATAAATWRFANPGAGRSLGDLERDVPLLLVRAGGDDTPGLLASLDRFVASALASDFPLSLVNFPAAPHAFDLAPSGEAARDAARGVLDFFRRHLLDAASGADPKTPTTRRPRAPRPE